MAFFQDNLDKLVAER